VNQYLIQGPASISVSFGRTSGYMLIKIVEAHQGTLPSDVFPLFANTAMEHESTYEFGERLAQHLGIKIRWLEYDPSKIVNKVSSVEAWREVDFSSALRKGEPFAEMIRRTGFVPTVPFRNCTSYLKAKPMKGFMRAQGYGELEYVVAAGIRADEPWRVSKMRARTDIDFALPLYDAGVTVQDVIKFWKTMPFDLGLDVSPVDNQSPKGNCSLCFLKNAPKLLSLIRDDPSLADWWIEQEASTGTLFRTDRPNYAALKVIALQPQLFDDLPADEAMPCECTD
jgi:3'-phosphoadenosine 5'-phosphosulfate sulfotransferase (PAPS reductase)/FAD synthetase